MNTAIEKEATKWISETDTMQFSQMELLSMFYIHMEQLKINLLLESGKIKPSTAMAMYRLTKNL